MDCPYAKNGFCASLTGDLKRELCVCCVSSRYPGGCVIDGDDWRGAFSLLLSGFMVSREAETDEGDSFSPMELIGGGCILTLPESWFLAPERHMISYVIKPCVIARFDYSVIEKLRAENREFAWAIASALQRKYRETAKAYSEIGAKDARRAVRYMRDFSVRYGVGYLTHAQIALATGLARPTVTKTLHELLLNDESGGARE